LIDVPKKAHSDIEWIPVEHMDQVLEVALAPFVQKSSSRTAVRKKASKAAPDATSVPQKNQKSPPPNDTPPLSPMI
jgi:predicted ATP-dependent protease